MVKTIIWHRKANNEFNAIINYLQLNWNDNVTKSFVERAYQIIEILKEHPEMGTIENYDKQIRGFVITKHNTLYYRIEGDELILLSFFDNRQNPKKRSNI
jgi:plasmid stabilization system protein ParE